MVLKSNQLMILLLLLGQGINNLTFLAQPKASDLLPEAEAFFHEQKFKEAESHLRTVLSKDPDNLRALSLMGAVLDGQKRYPEAETFYKRALQLKRDWPQLINNLGNHYSASGQTDQAKSAYLRVVVLEPNNINANLQLASLNVKEKKGKEALQYLDRLPSSEQVLVPVQLLRIQGLFWSGSKPKADALANQLEQQAPDDPRLEASLGITYVNMERFDEAEKAFNRALAAQPANLDVLLNLGLAATRAGHLDRAAEVFEAALRQRPDEVDALIGLARVYIEKESYFSAIELLVKVRQLAPDRAENFLLLAMCSEKINLFGDAAQAYDAYLKLRPQEDTARRERGYALARAGKLEDGLKDLEWYATTHPKDAQGLYLLGIGKAFFEPEKAVQCFNQALKLDPNFMDARLARGALLTQLERPGDALPDLQFLLQRQPKNAQALVHLGLIYLKLNRAQEAAEVLRQATEIAPQDTQILFQYSRALRKVGRITEMEQVLARFQALGGGNQKPIPQAGLYDYLSLPLQEQKARFSAGLRKEILNSPNDFSLRVRLSEFLLAEGQMAEAHKECQAILLRSSNAKVLSDCGTALIKYEQYEAARPFLEAALQAEPESIESRMNLAIAKLRLEGGESALKELEKVPESARDGDYFLLQSQIMDAQNRFEEAVQSLNRALKKTPTRANLYLQAAMFLLKHECYREALDLLAQASRYVPEVPELQLVEATTLELLNRTDDANSRLNYLQTRWPEWGLPYLIQGIILEINHHSTEARSALETTIALGIRDPLVHYYLARAILASSPGEVGNLQHNIDRALQLSPKNPRFLALAGRIALAQKDYPAAINYLSEATRLQPNMLEAYWGLSTAYRYTGQTEQQLAVTAQIEQLNKQPAKEREGGDSQVKDLLFAVQAPARSTRTND